MPPTKYLYRSRPPGIGCQPPGFSSRETWTPARTHSSGGPHIHFHGSVTYPDPLDFDSVWRYDLWPTDTVERASYTFWLEDGRPADQESVSWLRESYLSASVDILRKLASRGDTKAKAALVLKGEA